jgi:inorganic pyrophosphatase
VKYEIDKDSGALFVRPFPAHRDVLSRQLRLHPRHTFVGRWRPLRRAGRQSGAGGARCRDPLPAGRRTGDGRRSGRRREDSRGVPVDSLHPFYAGVQSYRDLPAIMCEQIGHFFQHYKDLEKGKWVTIVNWLDADGAEKSS